MKQDNNYIDLGLPSGRLWAKEPERGLYNWDETVTTFGAELPSAEAFAELWTVCEWYWDLKRKGMLVKGPNGNTLFMAAADSSCRTNNLNRGGYWSNEELPYNAKVGKYLSFGPERVLATNATFKSFYLNVIRCREK